MYGCVVHGHQWLWLAGPFPPSPSRACQGLPWRGATLIALCRAGSPIHGSGVEAAPCRGGATRLGWGRIGEKGKEKNRKGSEKKTCFSGGRACSLQATRLSAGPTPSHRRPPYPRRAYSSRGSSLVLGVYTWRPRVELCSGRLDKAPLVTRPRVRARAVKPKTKSSSYIKPGNRENTRYNHLLSQMHTAFCQCFPIRKTKSCL
jgi:hypothetical protein